MKTILLSAFILCVTAMGMHAQNLVTNGGFETWTDTGNMPDSWARGSGAWGVQYYYVTDGTQGNVLRLADLTSTSVSARRFNTTANFSVLTEGVYRVTFKVKGNVGLRAVVLVKGTTSPSTASQSATNHFTLTPEYPSGTNVADWTTLQYDINVPSTATFGTDYRLHFSWSSSLSAKPVCDFLIDDISLVNYVETPVISDKLSKIEITPKDYTFGTGTADLTIPNFSQDVLQYTFTSSYFDVPIVSATAVDATATVEILQPTSLTGTLAERTASITVTTTDSQVKTYTVEFVKHPGFISGIPWNLRTANYVEWGSQTGMYTRDAKSAGNIYAFGNTSARCNSTSATGFYLTTPVLENGASTLSFYLRNESVATDTYDVVVQKSTTADPLWSEIGRVTPTSTDYENKWKEVTMNINDNSEGLKIRFEFEKTITTGGKIYFDDVFIQPYSTTTAINGNRNNGLSVFSINGILVINSKENTNYSIFNLNGSKITEGVTNRDNSVVLAKGVYIVKTHEESVKVVL